MAVAVRRWRDPAVRLALIWLFASLLFFTGAATQREVYLLPVYRGLESWGARDFGSGQLVEPEPEKLGRNEMAASTGLCSGGG